MILAWASPFNWLEVLTGAHHLGSVCDIIVIMVFREQYISRKHYVIYKYRIPICTDH